MAPKLGKRRVKHAGSKNRPRLEPPKHRVNKPMQTFVPTYNVRGYRT